MEIHFGGEHFDVNVHEMIGRSAKLTELNDLLIEHHQKLGRSEEEAGRLAHDEIASLVGGAFGDCHEAYVGAKSEAIDNLIDLQESSLAFYEGLLKDPTGNPGGVGKLEGIFRDMETQFNELRKPVEKAIEGADNPQSRKAAEAPIAAAEVPADVKRVPASDRLKILPESEKWKVDGDVATRKYGRGVVELTVVGNETQITIKDHDGNTLAIFKEFDILYAPYSEKPLSSEVIQAHHGCQNALMEGVFKKYGYTKGGPPTIWLRNSTGGSPHGIITHILQPETLGKYEGDKTLSYGKIRDIAAGELAGAGVPEPKIREYIRAMDRYFDEKVAPNIPADLRAALIGERKPY